ncbi:TQO small subunit DoxD [Pontibacillus marinus]|uniref:Crp/Fnr family transcriptional regulator n=1 Tax=Pontibacillus marinus BH030004 = DSM 16465 TaxID=1385511 RepID=A0A0A5FUU7_9BACI|nr:DoxX family protein [Pontibacillus marinus]KGX84521.1 Crp/Fnr family transcriptional regulator [Pontibacillus marinus BH030004 = DSM 16465]
MFNTFLRNNQVVGIILTFLRVYLGYTWFTAGWGKLTGDGFNASGYLKGAIGKATGEHPAVQGWWATFLENVALPNSELFSFLVMWGEILVGIALILGVFTTFATLMGLTMNFAFLFSGTVSTNPQMVIIGIILLVAGYNAAKFGLDRWILPLLKKQLPKREQKNEQYA